MSPKLIAAGVAAVAVAVVGMSSVFVVPQAGQALVLQFGEARDVVQEPGLHVRMPFVQNVLYYDRRALEFMAPPEEVIAADQKRFVVDSFTTYRIADPLRFYQTVGTEAVARTRLSATMSGTLRRVLGSVPLADVLSDKRSEIMQQIRREVDAQARGLGLEVLDVRIRRADLPDENSQAIFARMQSEREREAREFRAQGAEAAQRIRSMADRDRVVLLAEAQRQAQTLRAQGDREAARVYSESYGRNEEFFRFHASMEAYRHALKGDATVVLSPQGEFFRYFADPRGAAPAPSTAPAVAELPR